MKVLDLFSGIGGFSLGLERAGMETVAFCEYDDKAKLVLKKHWPDVPIFNDVRKLNATHLEGLSIDLICGGFPCQPFSQAGQRKGEADDRHLWPEYFRLIQEIRPRWVIGENVAGLIGMGLDQVLSDLESEGYFCQTLVIPACAVNAPHRRDRVWICAYSDRFNGNDGRYDSSPICRERPEPSDLSGSKKNVAHPMHKQLQGSGSEKIIDPKGRKESARHNSECRPHGEHRLQPEHTWAVEPELGRVAHGVPGRVDRLKQLGNAVVPQVVEQIGRAIMKIERE